MQQTGLGPLLWWDQEDDPIDEEEYAEEQADGAADEIMEGME